MRAALAASAVAAGHSIPADRPERIFAALDLSDGTFSTSDTSASS
jgi:hypothetical protein